MSEIKIEVPEKTKSAYALQQTFSGLAMIGKCENESKEQVMKDFSDLLAYVEELNSKKIKKA